MPRIFVKPAAGKTPRAPMAPYARIPADGFAQEDSTAWRRLESAGDVIISTDEPPQPPSPAHDKAKK